MLKASTKLETDFINSNTMSCFSCQATRRAITIIIVVFIKRGEIQKGAQVTLFDSFYKKLLLLSHTES